MEIHRKIPCKPVCVLPTIGLPHANPLPTAQKQKAMLCMELTQTVKK